MTNEKRKEILEYLLNSPNDIEEVREKLKYFSWDCEAPLVVLKISNIKCALIDFIDSRISEDTIEKWANTIEGRDDIEYEIDQREEIERMVFELANPYLTQKLTSDRARLLISLC